MTLLLDTLSQHFPHCTLTESDCVVLEVAPEQLLAVCTTLRDDYHFDQLIDVCGVDYKDYGISHWRTHETTE